MDKPSCYNCAAYTKCWFSKELDEITSRWRWFRHNVDSYKLIREAVAAMCEGYDYGLDELPPLAPSDEDEDFLPFMGGL